MQEKDEGQKRIGDIKGGLARPKLIDNLFNNDNELLPKSEGNKTPLYIIGNLSSDVYFPINRDDIDKSLKKIPAVHAKSVTHIWFRKLPKKSVEGVINCQASYIVGNGINLFVFYPFPKDFKMKFGVIKPTPDIVDMYANYQPELIKEKHEWFLQWTPESIRNYYLNELFNGLCKQIEKHHSLNSESKKEVFTYYWSNRLRSEDI